jgi:hypothetical protein
MIPPLNIARATPVASIAAEIKVSTGCIGGYPSTKHYFSAVIKP